jgi:hypothetical protein
MSSNSIWRKAIVGYFSSVGVYGFYRGYNNLFASDKFNTTEILITNKILNGLNGAIWCMNPIYQPILIFGIMRRTEKVLRNMPLEKIDYYD